MEGIQTWWEGIQQQFYMNFIEDDRWKYLWNGLGVTLQLTFCAVLIGIVLGVILAMIRSTYDKNYQEMRPGFGRFMLKILNVIAKIYLTVIRGTPVVVQLMIMYYIILASSNNKLLVGMIAFGVNSGAYVAEIVRAGILAVDKGQMEAGRSLGLNKFQTMRYIIIPQAFKSILPPLGNEFIVLIKETSIVGYVGMSDLTRVANQMTSKLFDVFTPLLGIAFIYFVLTKVLSILLAKLERRLRKSDNR